MTKYHKVLETEVEHNTGADDGIKKLASDEDVVSDIKEDIKLDTVTDTTSSVGPSRDKSSEKERKASVILHPFVHWAQSQTHVSLRVDLIQVENLSVAILKDGYSLKFAARGTGAHGLQDYNFSLDFLCQVDEKVVTHAIERYVLILIPKKKQPNNWSRLTKQQAKFPWLRVDFDRYAGDSNSSGDDDSNEDIFDKDAQNFDRVKQQIFGSDNTSNSWGKSLDNIFKNVSKNHSGIYNPQRKSGGSHQASANMKYDYRKETVAVDNSKNTAKHALDIKKTYLFLYNLVMFIMFLKVNLVLIIKGLSGTFDDDIVQGAAFIVKMLTYTQLLESIHPILGLVPGGPMMPLLQVFGRIVVNHFLTEPTIRLDAGVYAPYLFIVWSSIEIFRYSFYALRIFKVNIYPLTWCRYTLFMPLYPCGGFCESMVVLSTIKYYEKTGGLSFNLPNAANISFSLPSFLRFYIFFLLGPSILYLMKYMWVQRCKQLQVKDKTA